MIKFFWFVFKFLLSNPGLIWDFNFLKNSCKNKTFKFSITSPSECSSGMVDFSNFNLSGTLDVYALIPLNPLWQFWNVVLVFDSYIIISSPILMRPFLSTNPSVLSSTTISVSTESISFLSSALDTKLVRLSTFTYLSIFCNRSSVAPWVSWET